MNMKLANLGKYDHLGMQGAFFIGLRCRTTIDDGTTGDLILLEFRPDAGVADIV